MDHIKYPCSGVDSDLVDYASKDCMAKAAESLINIELFTE